MRLLLFAVVAALLAGLALARAQVTVDVNPDGPTLLVVRTLGDSVAIAVEPNIALCQHHALAVIPPPGAHREKYSIVSAECFR